MCIASTCAHAAAPARSPFLGSFDEEMLAGIQLSQGGFLTPGVGFFGKPCTIGDPLFTYWAYIITYTLLGVPYYGCSIIYPIISILIIKAPKL